MNNKGFVVRALALLACMMLLLPLFLDKLQSGFSLTAVFSLQPVLLCAALICLMLAKDAGHPAILEWAAIVLSGLVAIGDGVQIFLSQDGLHAVQFITRFAATGFLCVYLIHNKRAFLPPRLINVLNWAGIAAGVMIALCVMIDFFAAASTKALINAGESLAYPIAANALYAAAMCWLYISSSPRREK